MKMPVMNVKRSRNIYLYTATFIVLALYFLTDPYFGLIQHLPFGAATVATVLILLKGIMYSNILHFTRKAIFDYNEGDFKTMLGNALASPTGAGLAAIALSVMTLAFAIVIYAATNG
jgi:hypothetical protein